MDENMDEIMDEIIDKGFHIITENNEMIMIETSVQLMYDFIKENPLIISDPDFNEILQENIKLLWDTTLPENNNFFKSSVDKDEYVEDTDYIIELSTILFYKTIIPPRSFPHTFTQTISHEYINTIQNKINKIKNKNQPSQRTPEWYTFRHNLITASNAFKAFENQNTQNQLIYEKCKPPVNYEDAHVNVESSLHWGQKYEYLSVMLYEKEYNTKIGDFGCLQHSDYPFLGASPDGINIDPSCNNTLYGRMLEIKNVVSREIDGIPKKEYWIQMQLQMEVCDLDECDFLETKFTEYESEIDFINDTQNTELKKGIIMYFSNKISNKPVYIHKPYEMSLETFELWGEKKIDEYSHLLWIKNIYWKLDEFSCVLVIRNRIWFQDNVYMLQEVSDIIKKERITGYEHRAPKKRVLKNDEFSGLPSKINISSFYKKNEI